MKKKNGTSEQEKKTHELNRQYECGKVDETVAELFEWNEMKNVSCSSIRMAFNAYEMCIKGNL